LCGVWKEGVISNELPASTTYENARVRIVEGTNILLDLQLNLIT
jgi:hypothetical protein